ncbi:MAG: hypothetical protein ACRDT2_04260 [Natronosporangium sp.]
MTTTPATTVANPAPERSSDAPPDRPTPGRDPVAGWLAERGVLFVLLQTPVIGVLVAYVYSLDQLDSAVFPVFVAFSALTGWVAYRKARSTDPAEPVHRLHLYALYALLPVAVFSVVQIPFIGADPVYWATWLELGTQFTNSGVDPWSFLAGVVWSMLVGVGLVLGYYVLFRRHDLVNAGLYFGVVFLAAAVYVLPVFSPVTAQVGVRWYLSQVVAFAALAATAWAMPAFWNWVARPAGRPRWPDRPRVAALAGAVLVLLAPYGVAAERTANWQLDEQRARDLAAFDQVRLEATGVAGLRGVDAQTARYAFVLRLGPRSYTTAAGLERAVDAGPVVVEGRLATAGSVAAWCTGHVAQLETPNGQRAPDAFAVAARRLEYVDIALSCAGPAAAIDELLCPAGRTLTASWRAEATLIGERTIERRELSGQAPTRVELPNGMTC